MTPRPRIVVDTNALVSRLLLPTSVPAHAVDQALDIGQLVVSESTLSELASVLARPKFDRYVTVADRQQFLRLLGRVAELVPIVYQVQACRDPADDKFLELAINGEADLIVTGDDDLLALDPFRGVSIVTPAKYLAGA